MKRKLIAISLAIVLVGVFSTVAIAQEEQPTPLPIKPVFGTQLTFGLGWLSYAGVDFGPLEVDFGGVAEVQTDSVQFTTFGPLFKLDYYANQNMALYAELGLFYDFSDDTKSAIAGGGLDYTVSPNIFVYGDFLFIGEEYPTYYEFTPGLTAGIKLRL